MYSFCNLLLLFCSSYFIRKSRTVSSPNLALYRDCFFAKNNFFSFVLTFILVQNKRYVSLVLCVRLFGVESCFMYSVTASVHPPYTLV